MKPLYPPPGRTRRSPLPLLLAVIVVLLGAALWYLSSSVEEQPLTVIEADVSANAS